MKERRRLVRLDVGDFLQMRLLDNQEKNTKGRGKNITHMGICFTSEIEWHPNQTLLIDYFLPDDLESVQMKLRVLWTEFIDPENGYFCGGELTEIEAEKQDLFVSYYLQKLKERP